MESLSKILVPIEFSPRCVGAAQYAEVVASRYDSEIILLHAVVSPVLPYGPSESLAYSSVADFSEEHFEQLKAHLLSFLDEELRGMRVRRVIQRGDPARVIHDFAVAEKCGLIVMPTHGYGPFRRFLLGSVTAKVLHDAPCPVCTGPHMEEAPDHTAIRMTRVLCAVDFGIDTRPALAWAAGFARDCGARLGILHVLPSSTMRLGPMYFDPDWHQQMDKYARNRILGLQEELVIDGEVLIETGEIPDAVSRMAQLWNADLLVIGRGQVSGIVGRLRTNAYAILRESPCPVVTV